MYIYDLYDAAYRHIGRNRRYYHKEDIIGAALLVLAQVTHEGLQKRKDAGDQTEGGAG